MGYDVIQHCAQVMHEVMPVIGRTLHTEVERRQIHGISHVQIRALLIVHDHPGVSLSVFAEHFGTLLPTASKLIDGLVARGYVLREPVEGDRRRVALFLTAEGEAMLEVGHAAMLQVLTEQLAPLTEEDCAVVERAFRILQGLFLKSRPDAREDAEPRR